MLIHQLVVLPTEDTLDYLSQVFSGSPIDLDLKTFHVELNSSVHHMDPKPDNIYKANAGTLKRYYDSATGETSLILPLDSPQLTERCRELRVSAPSAFYGNYYFPFLVIKRNMPLLKPHRRGLVNISWADTLAANHYPLMFDAETLITKEYHYAPDMDYYTTRVVEAE
jgi:hypothetical protein